VVYYELQNEHAFHRESLSAFRQGFFPPEKKPVLLSIKLLIVQRVFLHTRIGLRASFCKSVLREDFHVLLKLGLFASFAFKYLFSECKERICGVKYKGIRNWNEFSL